MSPDGGKGDCKIIEDKALLGTACACPKCGALSMRHSYGRRHIQTFDGRVRLLFAKYYCSDCNKYFNHPGCERYAPSCSRYGRDVYEFLKESGLRGIRAVRKLRAMGLKVPTTTVYSWFESEDWG